MRNLTVKIQDERHQDLILIQEFFSQQTGLKLNQTQTLEKLLFQTANVIKNTGDLKYEVNKQKKRVEPLPKAQLSQVQKKSTRTNCSKK